MAAQELQAMLRFLSQDAKVPLATSMSKVKDLQKVSLMTPEALSKSDLKTIVAIFEDDKISKQVHNAAKRVTKKRTAPDSDSTQSPSKRGKRVANEASRPLTAAELEVSLALPSSDKTPEELESITLFTNRAPLLLAFCLILLNYSMPSQPPASRLSLAHAYVSVSSRSRAVDLGIEKGTSAQEDGWGAGQPTVTIMGKRLHVMRRTGYEEHNCGTAEADMASQSTLESQTEAKSEPEPALWGLDLEALKRTNLNNAKAGLESNSMPIYTPQSARTYLLKAGGSIPHELGETPSKKRSAVQRAETLEENLGMLLKAIGLVYESWLPQLTPANLDRRTWGWYAQVRPEIASGKAGWGAKNEVKLRDILALRRK